MAHDRSMYIYIYLAQTLSREHFDPIPILMGVNRGKERRYVTKAGKFMYDVLEGGVTSLLVDGATFKGLNGKHWKEAKRKTCRGGGTEWSIKAIEDAGV